METYYCMTQKLIIIDVLYSDNKYQFLSILYQYLLRLLEKKIFDKVPLANLKFQGHSTGRITL